MTLYIPKIMIAQFANNDTVSFEGSYGEVQLLLEKDFTGLDNVSEDQNDNYPNPLSFK
nr:hypothetical protein [Mucilaginibacter corticis]